MPNFYFEDGLILFTKKGNTHCLGYLLNLHGKIFDADLGLVDVTEEQAEKHNQVFDTMIVKGLDTCQVKQGHTFYYKPETKQVTTWLGTVIGDAKRNANKVIVVYKGKIFEGNLRKNEDSIFLQRVQ